MRASQIESLLRELGFTTVTRGRRLQHPSQPPAMTYHASPTGEVWFAIQRRDAARFGDELWQRISPRKKAGKGQSSVCVQPVAGRERDAFADLLAGTVHDPEAADDAAEALLRRRRELAPAMREQLLLARRGLGEFRRRVEMNEDRCRATGVLDRRHLRARHIKPWRLCSDQERLDGSNGLLLSPHVDHLFVRGHISFADDGALLVSRHLNPAVLEAWQVKRGRRSGSFTPAQRNYLDYHRQSVFERAAGGRRREGR